MLVTETQSSVSSPPASQPPTPDFSWKEITGSVEPFLEGVNQQLAEQVDSFDPGIAEYARYALTGQGKQLRPVLVALGGGAVGAVGEGHVKAAVIIEMIHLATLVHDDVMDEAGMRRGRATLAVHWGNEVAVLLGDCLFAQALKLASSYPTTEICRAVAAATNTVCAGEILQTQARHNFQLTRDDYFKVLRMKTGELFAVSCDLGAFLSEADLGQRHALRQFGLALGTAYQVFDDCLDLFGAEEAAGKSLGTDLAQGKVTLPVLVLLEQLESKRRRSLLALLADWEPSQFAEFRRELEVHSVLSVCRQAVEDRLSFARQLLECLPESESRSSLRFITDYLGAQMNGLGKRLRV